MKKSADDISLLINGILGLVLGVLLLVGLIGVLLYGQAHWFSPADKSIAKVGESPILKTIYRGLISKEGLWQAPDWETVDQHPDAEAIKYGRELIANTAAFLGPNGSVAQMSNGMNCQNCHLDAGTATLGNNFSAVAANYPKNRARSGDIEDIPHRINDCFERSLNGNPLPVGSPEMKAMVAYIQWVGKDVPKGTSPHGSGLYEVPYMTRAADPVLGKQVYDAHCQSCHMQDGQGMMKPDKTGYIYPPAWGENSYNDAAGLYRLSRFAGFVKANMPLGATYERPILTDEEAWDVAAYVNSLERPQKRFTRDWPDITKKPIDHPFGPFADGFSEQQHKYGPFLPILQSKGGQP